jgi:uncharacterized membrane protein HdeD (DUF308 family)
MPKNGLKQVDTRSRAVVIITGVLLAILGICIFMNPGQTLEIVTMLLGWALVIFGAVVLIEALVHKDAVDAVPFVTQRRIAIGVCSAVFGLIILLNPRFFVSYIFILLGILVLITGINDCIEASAARRISLPAASRLTVLSVLTIVLGILLLVAPFWFASAATAIAGIVLVFDGVSEIIAGVQMPQK